MSWSYSVKKCAAEDFAAAVGAALDSAEAEGSTQLQQNTPAAAEALAAAQLASDLLVEIAEAGHAGTKYLSGSASGHAEPADGSGTGTPYFIVSVYGSNEPD